MHRSFEGSEARCSRSTRNADLLISARDLREEIELLTRAIDMEVDHGTLQNVLLHCRERDILRHLNTRTLSDRVAGVTTGIPRPEMSPVPIESDWSLVNRAVALQNQLPPVRPPGPGQSRAMPQAPPPTDRTHRLYAMREEFVYRAAMKDRGNSVVHNRPATRGRPMRTMLTVNGLEAYVLLDTGSTINAISPDFCRVTNIEVFRLSQPITLQLGTTGSRSKVNFGANLPVKIGGKTYKFYFDVASIDHYDMIIGTQIMEELGMVLNFKNYTIQVDSAVLHALEGEGDTQNRTRSCTQHTRMPRQSVAGPSRPRITAPPSDPASSEPVFARIVTTTSGEVTPQLVPHRTKQVR